MKRQIIIIPGGETFKTYSAYLSYLKSLKLSLEKHDSWKNSLEEELGNKFQVIKPSFPNRKNARYQEWKIIFDKIVKLLDKEIILIGYSLGGVFLAKYLAENKLNKRILACFLISAPYREKIDKEYLDGFQAPNDLIRFNQQVEKIFVFQSLDDPIVSFANAEEYIKRLDKAILKKFKKRQHFNQAKFPELVREIKKL